MSANSIVTLDMLYMRSVCSEEHFKYLDVLMYKWKKRLEEVRQECPFTTMWYTVTFRYNKTAWHRLDLAREQYMRTDKEFNTPLANTGLYWNE